MIRRFERLFAFILVGLVSLALGMSIVLPTQDTFSPKDETARSYDADDHDVQLELAKNQNQAPEYPDADDSQDPPQFYEVEMALDPAPKAYSQRSNVFKPQLEKPTLKFVPAAWGEPPEASPVRA